MAIKYKTRNTHPKKAATIRQVAEQAGVSIATVSRVFAGTDMVSNELAERVRSAAHSLNYRPNHIARNLRMQKTFTAALILSDIENPFFTSVVHSVEKVLRSSGYILLLADSDEDEQIEMEYLNTLRDEGVAGVILAPVHDDPRRYEQLFQAGMAVVAIDRFPPNLKIDRICINNADGTQAAVKHLASQGHTKIGFISGRANISTSNERQSGYECAMRALGLSVNPDWIQSGNFRRENGFQALQKILTLDDRPTAVISANNLMTLGALQAIFESKLRIPEDMAIVGFDDMAWGKSLNPPLTAVVQPTHDLGVLAAQMLLDRIENPDRSFRQVILDTQLVIRESSGPHCPGG